MPRMADNNTHSKTHEYRPEIDGLRTLAVLVVILFHAFPKALPGGFVGVDVFFVISGFLITGILEREIHQETFTFSLFYARRFRRLLPAFLLTILAVFVTGWFALSSQEFKLLGKHIFGASGFLTNMILWREQGYFDSASELKPLLHFWSLAVEEQFYLLWPAFLLILFKKKWPALQVVVGVLLLSFIGAAIASYKAPEFAYYSVFTRLWQLGAGALLVFLPSRPAHKPRSLLALIFVLMIIVPAFLLGHGPYTAFEALLPTIATAGLIYFGRDLGFVGKVFTDARVRYIGLLSYPLYLWHWPLLAFLRISEGPFASTSVIVVSLILSFVLSALTYHLVEKPAQKWMNFNRPGMNKIRVVVVSTVILFILCVAGLFIFKKNGLPQRNAAKKLAVITFESPLEKLMLISPVDPCPVENGSTLTWSESGICLKKKDSTPKVVIWGDSLSFGVASALEHEKINSVLFAQAGCPPILGVKITDLAGREKCAAGNEKILDYILKTPELETVILVSIGAPYMTLENGNKPFDTYFNHSGLKERRALYQEGFEKTVSQLTLARKKVILYLPHPSVKDFIDPSFCTSARPLLSDNQSCVSSIDDYQKWQSSYFMMMNEVQKKFPEMTLFSPRDIFCDQQNCHALINGESLYLDSTHLTQSGAFQLGKPMWTILHSKKTETPIR